MSLLKAMIKYSCHDEETTAGSGANPSLPSQPVIYVSTSLDILEIEDSRDWPEDKEIDGTLFRRLSPEYFAWLRSRIVMAQAAYMAGKIPEEAWNALRQRFKCLQETSIREFGKESLQEVLRSFSPRNYKSPMPRPEAQEKPAEVSKKDWIYPGNQAWKCKKPVTSLAIAKLNAIRDKAMAKGWSEVRLYQNQGRFRFPCGEDYGLVCFLHGDQEIGEITERFIEIVHGPKSVRPKTLRFFNPDVPQPWMKKVEN